MVEIVRKQLDFYAELPDHGKISRREFMGRAAALGVTGGLASTMAGKAIAATPKKGGHVRAGLGHGSTTDSLDPGTYENGFTGAPNAATNNVLAEIGPSGQPEPNRAESRDDSDDPAVSRLKIRHGA